MAAGARLDTGICCKGSLHVEKTTTTNAESRRKNLSLIPTTTFWVAASTVPPPSRRVFEVRGAGVEPASRG